jgi:hypothetical protein
MGCGTDHIVITAGDVVADEIMVVSRTDWESVTDEVKWCYAAATQQIAGLQYWLAWLASEGKLDPSESMPLQDHLVSLWETLYSGTVCAIRDWDTPDCTWDAVENRYSDGTLVVTRVETQPESINSDFPPNKGTMSGDGAINDFPLHISATIAVAPDRRAGVVPRIGPPRATA